MSLTATRLPAVALLSSVFVFVAVLAVPAFASADERNAAYADESEADALVLHAEVERQNETLMRELEHHVTDEIRSAIGDPLARALQAGSRTSPPAARTTTDPKLTRCTIGLDRVLECIVIAHR